MNCPNCGIELNKEKVPYPPLDWGRYPTPVTCLCGKRGVDGCVPEGYLPIRYDDDTPWVEDRSEHGVFRHFFSEIDPMLLRWHWDEKDRIVEPLDDNDWLFQFDNHLPIPFISSVSIKRGEMHRLIKGTTGLSIKITEGAA